MLVLSRKFNEKLVLPLIQTTIQIVSVKPGVVRLGIDAPERIKILRDEIHNVRDLAMADQGAMVLSREEKHAIFNQLNTVNLAVMMIKGFQERGMLGGSPAEVETTRTILDRLLNASEQITEILNSTMQERDPKPAVQKPKAPEVKVAAPQSSPRKRRALLVEDDSNERELLAGLLEMHGLEVVSVEDGTDALEYLSHDSMDVALIDMMLPRKDGLSTIREIRRDHAFDRMKIYAMTGRDRDEFDLGPNDRIDAWFSKPLNPRKLLQRLDKALEH